MLCACLLLSLWLRIFLFPIIRICNVICSLRMFSHSEWLIGVRHQTSLTILVHSSAAYLDAQWPIAIMEEQPGKRKNNRGFSHTIKTGNDVTSLADCHSYNKTHIKRPFFFLFIHFPSSSFVTNGGVGHFFRYDQIIHSNLK